MSKPLTIVAVANEFPHHDYLVRGFNAFNKSCLRYGYEPEILGWHQPWRGLGSKPKLLKQAIERGEIKTDHIIFADAYDVFFSGEPGCILEGFLAQKAEIVWNAERNCFPNSEWAELHPKSEFRSRFFNSGLSVGRTDAYLRVLTQMRVDEKPDDYRKPDGTWHHENDQQWFMEKFLFGQCGEDEPKMNLDDGCRMFQNMVNVAPADLEFSEGGIKNVETQTIPLAWHFAGGAKTAGLMEPILAHLKL